MTLAIIDYGSGNLRSVAKAFEHVAPDTIIHVTNDLATIKTASHVVLPGVGAFGDCIYGLQAVDGLLDTLNEHVQMAKKPFLGICVGMQMMFEQGLEHGDHPGLGWLNGKVVKITPSDPSLKIPHMGWNELKIEHSHPITAGIHDGDHTYFVHSYHGVGDAKDVIASTDYAGKIAAIVGKDHMVGTQFHPEKSQKTGLSLLANFLSM